LQELQHQMLCPMPNAWQMYPLLFDLQTCKHIFVTFSLKAPAFCSLFSTDVNYPKIRYCWKKCLTLLSASPSFEGRWLTTQSNCSSFVMTLPKPNYCSYVASSNINYQRSSFIGSLVVLTWRNKPCSRVSITPSSMLLGGIAHIPVSFVRTIQAPASSLANMPVPSLAKINAKPTSCPHVQNHME
jgi:hypothetical protein